MADLTQFDLGAAQRIARVVRQVEREPPRAKPLTFDLAPMPVLRRDVLRICTFDGSWAKGTTKSVTLKYQTATPNVFTAVNLFAQIGTSAVTARNCAIALEGTAWFLIAAEC